MLQSHFPPSLLMKGLGQSLSTLSREIVKIRVGYGVSHKHLQSYLGEFCYRFNRRFNELKITDRLLTACLATFVVTYAELTR